MKQVNLSYLYVKKREVKTEPAEKLPVSHQGKILLTSIGGVLFRMTQSSGDKAEVQGLIQNDTGFR